MTSHLRPVAGRAWLLGLLACAVGAVQAGAQAATVSGKVTSVDGVPIQGANVLIEALNLGVVTGTGGAYSLTVPETAVKGQRVSITARYIGFSPQTRQITISAGTQTQDFALKADPFRLDEMVITGTTDATSQKKLSFSVAHVSEEQLKEVPASSPVAALAGKVSGARIAIGRGNPGAAPTIRLRGSTSLGIGASTPLIIVDGVLTRNNIADIDANDIESIEVLKGAAGASMYGSDAANGVIQITTRRGKNIPDNRVQFSSRSEYGGTDVEHFVPLNEHHAYALNPDGTIKMNGTQRVLDPDGIADNPYPTSGPDRWRNQLKTWLTDGKFYTQNFQLGARRGNTNLNTSYSLDHNQGILPFIDGQYRHNLRMNVDQNVGIKADISGSFTYGMNKNDYGSNASDGWFALLQSPGDIDLVNPNPTASDVPYYPLLPDAKAKNARGNPLYGLKNADNAYRRERILGSLSGRYRPFTWLKFEASYGTDRLNERNRFYQFRGFLNEGGSPSQGSLQIDKNNNLGENTQLNATATKLFFGSVNSTTRAAYLVERSENESSSASGSKFNVTDVPDLAALDPTQTSVNSGLTTSRTIDYLVSQTLDIKDRYIIDVLGRRDGSSLFGPNERWQDFYRISGAYRITEDVKIPGIQELRIRAARGTAGLRPAFDDQYETYSVSGGQITKQQLGNKNLKPAIQTENEYGVNVQFLDRFDLEVVHADRTTRGAFLNIPLSLAQSGGFTTQVQNAADVGAKTTELALQTRLIDRNNFSWSISLTGDHTTQRILSMNRAPFRVNAGGQGQDVFYYKAGEPLGIIYGTRWVRSIDQLRDNPANATNFDPSQYVVNSDGYVVRAANLGKTTEAPIAYVDKDGNTQHVIGDVNPDFSFGLANNFRWHNFSAYMLFDGVQGGDIYNFTKQWMFQDERHGDQDQSNRPQDKRRPLGFYSAGLYNGLVANDYFVEDGSYVKLRELSIAYDFSPSLMRRLQMARLARGMKLALIGRNLITWTNYTGFDPEVTSGNDFNFRVDGFRYPNFRTITGQVELRF